VQFTIFVCLGGDDTASKMKKSHSVLPSKSVTKPIPAKSVSIPFKSPSTPEVKEPLLESVPAMKSLEEAFSRTLSLTETQQGLEDAYNSLKCPYRNLCKRFLETLSLPGTGATLYVLCYFGVCGKLSSGFTIHNVTICYKTDMNNQDQICTSH